MVRTRIAPSPTGFPHIGTIYQVMFDYVFAKKYGGQFIVRLEDTDRNRFVEGAEDVIFDALSWFNLQPDESSRNPGNYGPYRQSERKDKGIYHEYRFGEKGLLLKTLPMIPKNEIDKDNQNHYCAYFCFCTKERLEELRNSQQAVRQLPRYDKHCLAISRQDALKRSENELFTIRLNVRADYTVKFDDWLVGSVAVSGKDIDDQVLLKSDGYPTYHFGVVVDDYLMKITHVFRGREWLPSTPKHILLYYYFGWERPNYIHLPVILNTDGKGKLSKRHGHASVDFYKNEGYFPEAILNYLANIVWNHPDGKEIFTMDEFSKVFHSNQIRELIPIYVNTNDRLKEILSPDEKGQKFITSQGPRFDLVKLTWVNQQYMLRMPHDELSKRLKNFYPWLSDDDLLNKLLPLVKDRMQTLRDFEVLAGHFFHDTAIALRDEKEKAIAAELQSELSAVTDWQKEPIMEVFKKILQKYTIRMPVLYYIMTGKDRGLPLPESLVILGKEKTLKRLTHIRDSESESRSV